MDRRVHGRKRYFLIISSKYNEFMTIRRQRDEHFIKTSYFDPL